MNKAASEMGKLSAKKRKEKMGEEAYRDYFKKLRNTPPKSVIPSTPVDERK